VYRELIPFAVLAAGAAALSIVALHPPGQLDLAQKLAVSAFSLVFYLWKTLAPADLSPLYEMPQLVDPAAPRFVVSYAVVAVVAVVAWMARRRAPAVTTALAVFLVISLPMLGVVQNGPQIAADRYTYHAAPALAMLVATAFLALPRPRALLSVAAPALVIGLLGALTWKQTEYWRGPEALWSRVLEVDSTSAMAQSAMANVRYQQDRVAEGIAFSERAVALAPNYAEAHNGLGVGLSRTNRVPAAINEYERALELKPSYDEAENNLGIALSSTGSLDTAIAHYRRALEINPDNAGAEINWGNALVRLDRPRESIPHYERALALQPANADAHLNWGVALAREGRYGDAIKQFDAALSIDPGSREAKTYLDRATALLQSAPSRP
jgi:tetratricopeptide (TPR) repeat protein